MGVVPTPFGGERRRHRHAVAWIALAVFAALAIGVLVGQAAFDGSSGSSAVEGSGVAAAQPRRVPAFNSVVLAGSNVVAVQVGRAQSVVVRGDDNLLRHVTTRVDGGGLVVDADRSFTTKSPMRVDVRVPSLDALRLRGSGVIAVAGVQARRLTVALPGSGIVRASGTATRLDVTLGGSGDVQLGPLAARDVRASVTGSGRIVVDATRTLDASIAGSGTIVYGGAPAHVTTSVTGSGAVVPG